MKIVKLLCAASSAFGLGCFAADIQMSPNGEVRTLQQALEKARALRAAGQVPAGRTVEVSVAPGRYVVTASAVFTPGDSNIRFTAEKDGQSVFDGGIKLPSFTAGADGLWHAQVPAGLKFEQFYVNGRRAQRARTPNKFYLYMERPWEDGLDPRTGQSADLTRHAFYAEPKDVASLAALPESELKDAEILVWQSWDQARSRIDYVDAKTGLLVSKTGTKRPLFFWSSTRPRYALENYRAALDAPGEWFHDKTAGEVLYIPRPGETLAGTQGVVPIASGMASFVGEPAKEAWVQNVSFKGLAFEHTAWLLPPEGALNAQSAQNIRTAAFFGDGVRNLTMDRCRISHVGAHAIWLKQGCRNCVLTHNLIEDLGGGGIYLGDTGNWRLEKRENVSGFNLVENNIIRAGGFTFNGAIGIWIAHASDNVVAHNDVGDFRYTGVSMGWTWGYAETVCHRNQLLWNRIHHIGQGVLSDMGGIYTLGNSEGTVEMGNWIHDVNGYAGSGSPAWGLYTDEGSRGILMTSNLVERCRDGAVHQHYGRENVWANNIFATFDKSGVWRSRIENHTTVIVTNNIFWWTNPEAQILNGAAKRTISDIVFNDNVYWCTAGISTNAWGGRARDLWMAAGHDTRSQIADPLFVDPAKGDWRLLPDSPALKKGFVPWDWTFAGVSKDDVAWRAKAMDDSTIPALEDAPPAPRYVRTTAFARFALMKPGQHRMYGALAPADKAGIAVVKGEGPTGASTLKLVDGPNYPASWHPHLTTRVNCDDGAVRIRFLFKTDDAVSPQFECRSYHATDGAPYAVGPTMTFTKGVIRSGRRELLRVAPGTWCAVDVLLRIAGEKALTWDCTLTPKDGGPVRVTDLPVAKNFKTLEWIGFMTNGATKGAWYIDDFSAEPVK